MKFTIEINCDNAAFDDGVLTEVARILGQEAVKITRFSDGTSWSNTLLDIRGNKVGRAELINDEQEES